MMKKLILLLLAVVIASVPMSAKKHRTMNDWDGYQISAVKVGADGTKLVKVWGYGKNIKKAILQAKKNAVHACLFQGVPGTETVAGIPALCRQQDVVTENESYFEFFFADDGEYLKYLNVTTDTIPSGADMRKVRGGYKVALYVQVLYDNLREKLEDDGIIKGLSHGF